ncbi:MAG: hypothetical protein ACTSUB_07045 [Candidatus Thorarchaeota archaeon]
MKTQLQNLRDLKPDEFKKTELKWLKAYILGEFKVGVLEEKISFSNLPDAHLIYLKVSKNLMRSTPLRFLRSELLLTDLPGKELKIGPFMKLDLLYWYDDNIDDIWGYKKLMDPLFYEVFHGENTGYDESAVGYRVLDTHLKKVSKGWKPFEKTLLIGYLCYMRLLKKATVPSLESINEGLKDKTLKYFGLTKADTQSFGKVTHRGILGVCWNCGDTIEDVRSGLCKDCLDYWDEKTR